MEVCFCLKYIDTKEVYLKYTFNGVYFKYTAKRPKFMLLQVYFGSILRCHKSTLEVYFKYTPEVYLKYTRSILKVYFILIRALLLHSIIDPHRPNLHTNYQ